MSKTKKTVSATETMYNYTLYKLGKAVYSFSSTSLKWEDIRDTILASGEYSESQNRVVCLNNSVEMALPSTNLAGFPQLPGKEANEVVLLILPKDSKAGSTYNRSELYAQVKEILQANPGLKAKLGNYTQVSSDNLVAFIKNHPIRPTASKSVSQPNTSSLKDMRTEELIAELERRNAEVPIDEFQEKMEAVTKEYCQEYPEACRDYYKKL